jgi:serine/threonine protein kinase
LNTYFGDEIRFPLFLGMSFETDLRLELELTRGGEASIHQGTLVSLYWKEKYANISSSIVIKRFFTKVGATPQEQEKATLKFQQEVAVIFGLQECDNVVKLLGFTQNPNTIVMPLYFGDLSTYIHDKEKRQYSFADVISMIQQLIKGLKAIHANSVAHRDFKPKNVLLAPKETEKARNPANRSEIKGRAQSQVIPDFPYVLKITDFGVCYLDTSADQTDVHGLKAINKFGFFSFQ